MKHAVLIGAGRMGSAMARGWLADLGAAGLARLSVVEPSPDDDVVEAASDKLAGTSWVITGTLSEDRETIADTIRANGGKVSSGVSGKTTYLLAGNDAGSKLDKATKLGVKVLAEPEFRAMLA
jgi:DNA ligase (NAD+)